MKEQKELRIIARTRGTKIELSVYDVYAMKEHRTGWEVSREELDDKVYELKETLEKSGNRVTFKSM